MRQFWILLLVSLTLLPVRAWADSCYGIVDYADELVPTSIAEVATTQAGAGTENVEITFDLDNTTRAVFDGATAVPDLTRLLEDHQGHLVQHAIFATLDGGARVSPDQTLVVEVAEGTGGDLLAALVDGSLPIEVYAEERPQLKPGHVLHQWTDADASAYLMGLNPDPDPFGPAPWDDTQTYGFQLYYPDGAPDDLATIGSDTLWFEPADQADLTQIPAGFHYFVADDVEVIDGDNGQYVNVEGRISTVDNALKATACRSCTA